jgi:hypothetical protein
MFVFLRNLFSRVFQLKQQKICFKILHPEGNAGQRQYHCPAVKTACGGVRSLVKPIAKPAFARDAWFDGNETVKTGGAVVGHPVLTLD